jgi:hypothetical protein
MRGRRWTRARRWWAGVRFLPPHEPLEERVQVHDDPEGEEELAEERAPGAVPVVVDGVGDACDDADHVVDDERGGRHQQTGWST